MVNDIKKALQEGVDNNKFPGAQFAIVFKNGVVKTGHVGYKQILPVLKDNDGTEIYDVASLTKVLSTTTMIMKLIEEKQINLDTKISDIFPKFQYQEITIYHLLTHTSGLPADIRNAKSLKNRKEVLEKVFQYEQINKAGTKIVYSDIGYILLGLVIEKITSKSLAEYSKEVIFEPLKMDDTSYYPDAQRCAPTEVRNDDVFQGILKGKVHDEKAFALDGLAGHAGLFSTASDIAKFILAILQDDFVLNTYTTESLFVVREERINDYGNKLVRTLGWEKPSGKSTAGDHVDFDNTILHTGFTGCNMFIDKKNGIGFVMLSNAVHPKRELNGIIPFRNRISNLIFAERE